MTSARLCRHAGGSLDGDRSPSRADQGEGEAAALSPAHPVRRLEDDIVTCFPGKHDARRSAAHNLEEDRPPMMGGKRRVANGVVASACEGGENWILSGGRPERNEPSVRDLLVPRGIGPVSRPAICRPLFASQAFQAAGAAYGHHPLGRRAVRSSCGFSRTKRCRRRMGRAIPTKRPVSIERKS